MGPYRCLPLPGLVPGLGGAPSLGGRGVQSEVDVHRQALAGDLECLAEEGLDTPERGGLHADHAAQLPFPPPGDVGGHTSRFLGSGTALGPLIGLGRRAAGGDANSYRSRSIHDFGE